MANPSQTILPHSFQVAHESLTQELRAAVEQFSKNLKFRDAGRVCHAIERFVDELYRVPGAADELLRRSSIIEQSCGLNTPYDQAKLQALKSYKGRLRKRSAAKLAVDALRSSAANPTILGQVSEERTRLEQVLAKGGLKLSDKPVDAFEQWLCQCREIQMGAERLEVDGCFYLYHVHRATQPKPPDASNAARAIIEGGGIGGANLDSMLAAVESLVAWVRENQAVLLSETTGPESSDDHADTNRVEGECLREAEQARQQAKGRKTEETDEPGDDATEAPAIVTKRVKRLKWMAEAMLLVQDHPEWSNAKIAQQVGVHPSQLTGKRCPGYARAAALARGSKEDRPKGHTEIDPDTGLQNVEAYGSTPVETRKCPAAITEALDKLPVNQQADAFLDASQKAGGEPSVADVEQAVATYLADNES